jgi:hypothetical protein
MVKVKCETKMMSKVYINKLIKLSIKNIYIIIIEKNTITIKNKDNNIFNNQELELLNYSNPKNKKMLFNILLSLIYKYKNSYLENMYKDADDIENSVLYVYLLPILSSNNEFIIKVGYTSNLHKRYSELKKTFNVSEIYLIYVCLIKNEAFEKEIHSILKKQSNIRYYPIEKASSKKNEKKNKCVETYIFTYSTLYTIIQEVYKMTSKYDMAILDKQIMLTTIEKEKLDKQIMLATIEKEKSDNERAIIISNNEIEKLKILLELKKIDLELANNHGILPDKK